MNDKLDRDDFGELHGPGWDAIGKSTDRIGIEDIHDKAQDLISSLRAAGANREAADIVRYVGAFKSPTEVRRAVLSLQQQLELWRTNHTLPTAIGLEFQAQQLEDACRVILGIGAAQNYFQPISALTLSRWDKAKPYFRLALIALAAGTAVLAVPLLLIALGIDWTRFELRNETAPIPITQGQEISQRIAALERAKLTASTRQVTISTRHRCNGAEYTDFLSWTRWVCSVSSRKLSADGSPTYEICQKGQYHGLLFAITDNQLIGGKASAEVQLFATGDTPPGIYKIPLEASYKGYRMSACWGIDLIRRCNPPVADPEGEDSGITIPVFVVRVENAGSAAVIDTQTTLERKETEITRLRAQQELSASRQRREQVAGQILDAMSELETVRKQLTGREWAAARVALDSVTNKHDALSKSIATGGDASAFTREMATFQYLLDEHRATLERFESQAVEEFIRLLSAAKPDEKVRDKAIASVAKRFNIPVEYSESIYINHKGQVQLGIQKIAAKKDDQQAAVWRIAETRCGSPPIESTVAIDKYLRGALKDVQINLDECSPPQFAKNVCWIVTCSFSVGDPTPRKQKWTFYIERDEVVRHRP